MYYHYPNSNPSGVFTAEDVRHGLVALHTDYECPFCGRWQSVAQLGGYGGHCIQCGNSSSPDIAKQAIANGTIAAGEKELDYLEVKEQVNGNGCRDETASQTTRPDQRQVPREAGVVE